MQDTQERQERALARQGSSAAIDARKKRRRNLDDTPIYASTDTRRVPLGESGKFWVEIKEELDFGDQTRLDTVSVLGIQSEGGSNAGTDRASMVRLDLAKHRFHLCAVWIVGLRVPPGEDGKPVRWPRNYNDRVATIEALHPDWGDAIVEVITEHVAEREGDESAAQNAADEEAQITGPVVMGGGEEGGEPTDPPAHLPNGEYVAG